MKVLTILSVLVAVAAFFTCGILALAVMVTIAMSRSGPDLGEAIAQYWAIGAGIVLSATTLASFSFRPKLAIWCAVGSAGCTGWVVKMVLRL